MKNINEHKDIVLELDAIFNNPKILKIGYSFSYDLRNLNKKIGNNLFEKMQNLVDLQNEVQKHLNLK